MSDKDNKAVISVIRSIKYLFITLILIFKNIFVRARNKDSASPSARTSSESCVYVYTHGNRMINL